MTTSKLRPTIVHGESHSYPVLPNRGYDRYYYINARTISDLSKEDFEVKDTIKTTRGLATAFLKYSQKKKNNRVLLGNFIDNIVDINK